MVQSLCRGPCWEAQTLLEGGGPRDPRASTLGEKLWRLHLMGSLWPKCSRTAHTSSRWRAAASPTVTAMP